MTDADWIGEAELSLFALATTLLRSRWKIMRWMLVCGGLAAAWVFTRPPLYSASASFIPQGVDPSRSSLATLAGQFGVTVPTNQSLTPEFYAQLIKSRVLLRNITRTTFVVPEDGGRRVPFLALFRVGGHSPRQREDEGIKLLTQIVATSVVKPTGTVQLSADTRWPSVSLGIVDTLVWAVNDFNQRTRQSQAAAERKFVESRLAVAASELRAAEDRLEDFLRNNRQFSSSPELGFQRDRLQRDVALNQQVFTSLTQSYEEVRIREVRDTPVITLIETPSVAADPKPRRRLLGILFGMLLGVLIGGASVLASESMARRREQGDVDANVFVGTLGEIKHEVMKPVRWLRSGAQD
jgi:uncharacterized protein involved in exopolysaccharide biosynthesis